MIVKEVKLGSELIQKETIRPMIVQTACAFDSKVELLVGNATVNAKSIMGVMAIPLEEGSVISLRADGIDEDDVINAMRLILE